MKKLIIGMGFILILMGLMVAGPPTIPVTYTGNLIYGGEIVYGNFNVNSYIGGISGARSLGEASNGEYSIDVSSCYGCGSGDISFFVNGIEANEHPAYNGEVDYGKVIEMNLTFDEEIPETSLCGNGDINPGEQCDGTNINFATCDNVVGAGWTGTVACTSSCAFDISGCSYSGTGSSSSSSSSSSSGGGSSSSSSGGSSSSGSGGGKISDASSPISSGTSNEINQETIGLDSRDKTNSGITGAVTGLLGSTGGIALLFVIVILILGVAVIIIQKSHKKAE